MPKFPRIKKMMSKILLWLDGVPLSVIDRIYEITKVFKHVLKSPKLDIVVELTSTQIDDVLLNFLRKNIDTFIGEYDITSDKIKGCREISNDDRRVLCYLKTIIGATGISPAEIAKALFLWIANSKGLKIKPKHLELLHKNIKT